MFKDVRARFALRVAVVTILTGVGTAATIWVDNPYLKVAGAMATVLSGYLTIGAAVPQVEPNIGNKMEGT